MDPGARSEDQEARFRPGCLPMVTAEDVRELALGLPETSERPSYGTPGFRVKDRLFARLHQDGESLVLKMDQTQRETMAAAEPQKFFWTLHYQKYPWVLVRLAAVDRKELRELLTLAWLQTAPPREVAAFEAASGDQPLPLNPALPAYRQAGVRGEGEECLREPGQVSARS